MIKLEEQADLLSKKVLLILLRYSNSEAERISSFSKTKDSSKNQHQSKNRESKWKKQIDNCNFRYNN